MRPFVRIVLVSLLCLLPLAVSAQQLQELRDQYLTESGMLDADVDNYVEARERERQALQRLIDLNAQLDAALADPSVPANELIRLDAQISRARELAFDVSIDVAERRQEMAQRMRRLQEIVAEFRSQGVRWVEPNGQVGGSWLIDFSGVLGLLSLDQQGARVDGLFRLSNGRYGSAVGSFRGGRLLLELSEAETGGVGNLQGQLDDRGRLEGQWSARELASGRPSGGNWSADRVSLDEVFQLQP